MTASRVLGFVVGVALGASAAIGVGLATPRATPGTLSAEDQPLPVATEGAPQPVPTLAPTQELRLASYVESGGKPDAASGRAPWWSSGVPRVPAITQFDGGPLANANCAMASGAMLARLVYGIVTTGSQMRSLQDDQEGGTEMSDVQTALGRGWNVRFSQGLLTPLQLRALMYAGAGAEIGGMYGEIPAGLSLQVSFKAGHSIYLDGFREAGPEGPAAYYVIDPLGRAWSGYRGGWWPAEIVERFATVFGSGRIIALWGFAGGAAPTQHPVLPRSAYPGAPASTAPWPSPSAGESAPPGEDPMPTGDTEPIPPTEEPTSMPSAPDAPPSQAGIVPSAFDPLLARCTVVPAPAGCPGGLVALAMPVSSVGTSPMPMAALEVRYLTRIGPGTWQLVFAAPADASARAWVWPEGASAGVEVAVDRVVLDGRPLSVATLASDPTRDFVFVVNVADAGHRSASAVGTVTIGR